MIRLLLENGASLSTEDVSAVKIATRINYLKELNQIYKEVTEKWELLYENISGSVINGEKAIVDYFINKGTSPEAKIALANEALIIAAKHGKLNLVKHLILLKDANPAIVSPEDDSESLIEIAASNSRKEVVDYFISLQTGAENKKTAIVKALKKAIIGDNLDLVKHLVSTKFSDEIKPSEIYNYSDPIRGESILHFAIKHNQKQIVDLLLSKANCPKIKLELRNHRGQTPLYYAIINDNPNPLIVESLLKAGASHEVVDYRDLNAIDIASFVLHVSGGPQEKREIALRLMSYGAIPGSKPLFNGRIPTKYLGYKFEANELLKILKQDPSFITPELAKMQQRFGAIQPTTPEAAETKGYTVLQIVAFQINGDENGDNFDTLRLLIENGADFTQIDERNRLNITHVMDLDEDKHYSKIALPLLIAYGANTDNIINGSFIDELNKVQGSPEDIKKVTEKRVSCYVASLIRDYSSNAAEKKEILDYVFEEKNIKPMVDNFQEYLSGVDMKANLAPRSESEGDVKDLYAIFLKLKTLALQPRATDVSAATASTLSAAALAEMGGASGIFNSMGLRGAGAACGGGGW